jgi:hypothetical protein
MMMRTWLPILALLVPSVIRAAPATCLPEVLETLRQKDPNAIGVYTTVANPDRFSFWLDCSDALYAAPTAVHESTHTINFKLSTYERSAFYLPGGAVMSVPRFHGKLFGRNEIIPDLATSELGIYYRTYLVGDIGKQELPVLLDELNAYTHDLITGTALQALIPSYQHRSERDGLVVFMYYLELYLKRARVAHPQAWQLIAGNTEYRALLQKLWANAETALRAACPIEALGIDDAPYVKKVYSDELVSELTKVFESAGEKFAPAGVGDCGHSNPAGMIEGDTQVDSQHLSTDS